MFLANLIEIDRVVFPQALRTDNHIIHYTDIHFDKTPY